MNVTVHGPVDGDPLWFVMGWGNTPAQPAVGWLLDTLADAGFRTRAVEIPTNVSRFEREYLDPLAAVVDEEPAADRVLSHSTGGLIAAHAIDAGVLPERAVHLSPWWGLHPSQRIPFRVLGALPTSRELTSVEPDRETLGERAEPSERDPVGLSPSFVREVRRAQSSLPAAGDGEVAFCTLTDGLVGVDAVGERLSADRIRLYDGGHECFASTGREAIVADAVAVLRDGPEALE
ncbi:alpha/beta hydrolase [Halobaculum roseum]|uniref:Alpha/beta hydrolase n=1 Tax=Halobaculum roseum TaxID=2175149 RepID=A0ABD5MKL4_9EURY|nr:alpha/beta hydrolase [Halobaculum roseum]QZY03417.1 alpha/beta hydrolase [Halobaculum roseum]